MACLIASVPVAAKDTTYKATVETSGVRSDRDHVIGVVFEDRNRDGRYQKYAEPGVPDVMVSNGRDVVLTDADGIYKLPNIFDRGSNPTKPAAMTIFVTEPAGYDVPVDEDNIPQFFYHHLPEGSPANVRGQVFRFGGLPPTGPLPEAINFPLIKGEKKTKFKIAVSGDTQPYSNAEVGYVRDTIGREWAAMPDLEAVIVEGDVFGDDLNLFPRFKRILSLANAPQYYVPGNHDLDFDAPTDDNSFDTFKREWGPTYYSFDIGDVHFIVLDDVRYPCTPEQDNQDGLHGGCDKPKTDPRFNAVVSQRQIEWLKNDLAMVPKDKLIVLNMHVSVYSFINQNSAGETVDNQVELVEALGCKRAADGTFPPENCARPILALAGHTHTLEQIRPGESFEGWNETLDRGSLPPGRSVGPSPFPQIVTGAAGGSWWSGDFNSSVLPESWQRLGAPPGYFVLEFDGNSYKDTFKATGMAADKQMSIDLLTPAFVKWFRALAAWRNANPPSDAAPPADINDLPDTKQVLVEELGKTVLSVNVWNGSKDSRVEVSVDGRSAVAMARTQPGTGEGIKETLDPYALKRQMMVARHAYATQGDPRANGFELSRGSQQCAGEGGAPCTPRPLDDFFWADQSSHIWHAGLPNDLAEGIHVAKVTFTDHFGRVFVEHFPFEVVRERDFPFWDAELFTELP
ncbi:MAG: calcineurin-like phosphoesterase family protein [Alphaproteobacteria bacterium]|nr:calcineurin-like phosphoesterase family protein [Alphaproteobacteria bacterium]